MKCTTIIRLSPNPIRVTHQRNISYQRLKNWYGSLISPKPQEAPYGHITQIGDPVLRRVSDPIPIKLIASSETKFLVDRMKSVFNKYGCVGLSAPQIGVPLRAFIMAFSEKHMKTYTPEEHKSKEMSLVPFTVVINPDIRVRDFSKVTFSEACLSVRGYFADVPRYRTIELNGFDENGNLINIHLRGWPARIVQHELDHLNGKLYVDIMDRTTFSCSCWQVVNERNGKVALPFGPA